MCWELIAIINFLKIRMREDIFGTEKCKVTFGLKYIIYMQKAFHTIQTHEIVMKCTKYLQFDSIKKLIGLNCLK